MMMKAKAARTTSMVMMATVTKRIRTMPTKRTTKKKKTKMNFSDKQMPPNKSNKKKRKDLRERKLKNLHRKKQESKLLREPRGKKRSENREK